MSEIIEKPCAECGTAMKICGECKDPVLCSPCAVKRMKNKEYVHSSLLKKRFLIF